MLDYVWLIPLLPLIGVLINAILGRWLPRRIVAIIATLAVGTSFLVAALVFVQMLGLPVETETGGNGRERIIPLFSWIVAGSFEIQASILLDQLSILMTLVVTGVSTVIHIYSAGYMEGETYYNRYFTWLNLFVFMMLILVLGTLSLYMASSQISVDQQQFTKLQHDVRSAMFMISRDARSAGPAPPRAPARTAACRASSSWRRGSVCGALAWCGLGDAETLRN